MDLLTWIKIITHYIFPPKFKQMIILIHFKYLSLKVNNISYEHKTVRWKHKSFFLWKLNLKNYLAALDIWYNKEKDVF